MAESLQTQPDFINDAKSVFHELRTSLAALVDSVGADAAMPQEMSRRFRLDKTLTWKITRIVCGDDTLSAATHMPGRAALALFVEALEGAGAPAERPPSHATNAGPVPARNEARQPLQPAPAFHAAAPRGR